MIEIRHKVTVEVLQSVEADTLSGADLHIAVLRGAALARAVLTDANLQGAVLASADLRDAKLTSANLIGADLRHADLRGADLTDARLLVTADLTGVIYDRHTRWPAGFEPEERGARLVE